ncbi:MAG: HEAT repeat domain-containing protein [Candidatus Hydrogenedentota bacterium]
MKLMHITLAILLLAAGAALAQDADTEPEPVENLDEAFETVRTYDFGDSGAAQEFIIDAINARHGDSDARADIAARLADLLADDTTYACKRFACQQLYVAGTEAEVPRLAPLLTDPDLAHLARYALQVIPGGEAEKALIHALDKTQDALKVGLINSLRKRNSVAAVPAIAEALQDDTAAVRKAAAYALGSIGTLDAARALGSVALEADDPLHQSYTDAFLRAADNLAEDEAAKALAMYKAVYTRAEAKALRMAALEGWANSAPAEVLQTLVDHIVSDDFEWVVQAMKYVRTLEAEGATQAFVDVLERPNLADHTRALLIQALGDRGDAAALPAVTKALDSPDDAVRMAALEGLAVFGDASSAPLLAKVAAKSKGGDRLTARRSLERLPGAGVNDAIMAAVPDAPPAVRQELLRALGARGVTEAVPLLLEQARSGDADMQRTALEAVAAAGGAGDLPAVIDLLPTIESDRVRTVAQRTLAALAQKSDKREGRAQPLIKAMNSAGNADTRITLLRTLGEIADPAALRPLRTALTDNNAQIRQAAVAALAAWPDATPMETLVTVAEEDENKTVRSQALTGYVRMLREDAGEKPAREAVAAYQHAMELAESARDKRQILAGLSDIPDTAALEAVKQYLDDESLRDEAAVAAERIRSSFYNFSASANSEEASKAMDKDIGTRWTSGSPMKGGEWFRIDMTEPALINGLVLDVSRSSKDYPRNYKVYVYDDPNEPGEPVAQGEGQSPITAIKFEPMRARYIKIEQTGKASDGYFWSIDEMRILVP